MKQKTPEREFLENHPLVRFIDFPLENILITDGISVRSFYVDTKTYKSNIIERLKSETNIRNKMFVFYAPNNYDIYWSHPTYDPFSFEFVSDIGVRMAEINVSDSEWQHMMKDEIKKRDEKYEEFLYNENKNNKKYKYLVIKR